MLIDCLHRCILKTMYWLRLFSQVVTGDKNLNNVSLAEINTARHFYLSMYKLSFNETFDFDLKATALRTFARSYILLCKI